jgi:hypothetical protein
MVFICVTKCGVLCLHKDNLKFTISEVSAEVWFFADMTLLTGQSVSDVSKELNAFIFEGPKEFCNDPSVNSKLRRVVLYS